MTTFLSKISSGFWAILSFVLWTHFFYTLLVQILSYMLTFAPFSSFSMLSWGSFFPGQGFSLWLCVPEQSSSPGCQHMGITEGMTRRPFMLSRSTRSHGAAPTQLFLCSRVMQCPCTHSAAEFLCCQGRASLWLTRTFVLCNKHSLAQVWISFTLSCVSLQGSVCDGHYVIVA